MTAVFVLPLNSALNPFLYTYSKYRQKVESIKDEQRYQIFVKRYKILQQQSWTLIKKKRLTLFVSILTKNVPNPGIDRIMNDSFQKEIYSFILNWRVSKFCFFCHVKDLFYLKFIRSYRQPWPSGMALAWHARDAKFESPRDQNFVLVPSVLSLPLV